MAETMYAWSPIRAGGEVDTVVDPLGRERRIIKGRNVIPVGEEVSAEDLDVEDDEFQAYIDSGAVRPYPYPEDCPPDEAPIDFLRRRLREQAEQEVSEEQQLLMATGMGAVVSDEELVSRSSGGLEEAAKPAPAGTAAKSGAEAKK